MKSTTPWLCAAAVVALVLVYQPRHDSLAAQNPAVPAFPAAEPPVPVAPLPTGAPTPYVAPLAPAPVQAQPAPLPPPTAVIPPVQDEVAGPEGVWERQVGAFKLTLRIAGRRIHGTLVSQENGDRFTLHLEADYAVAKDCILFGIITGIELDESARKKDADGAAAVELQTTYVDAPFSFRFRVDDNVLTIKEVKFGGADKAGADKDVSLLIGRFKRTQRPAAPAQAASAY